MYSEDFIAVARTLDDETGGTVSIISNLIGDRSPSYGELAELQETAFKQFISENSETILDRLYDFYRPIWEAFEALDWRIEHNGKEVILNSYSPAGEELYETLYLDGENGIVKQLYDIYDDFDEEEHATMWLEAKRNGTSGVPSIWTLVHDAERITEMYERLFSTAQEKYALCTEEN